MSLFRLSNKIFELGLNAQEISIYAYLCSLPSEYPTLDGATVKVKQATIAQKCGLKAVQTVSKVISHLNTKGLVEPFKREIKQNKQKGTYVYKVNKSLVNENYFIVDRYIFGKLIPRQMIIYLFLCKAYNNKIKDSWNSFNDIANQTGMKREAVIKTVSELEQMKLIRRSRRKSKENRRVFVDNHYQIVLYVKGSFKGKKNVQLHYQYNRTNDIFKPSKNVQRYFNTLSVKCQEGFLNFFPCRGSP